ncbi:Na+/H+ antiporter NhaA [Bacteroides sedimenti]|uniref:Na+/H+ antiporter NhaA n=1 Tax=Bacteroides sedimenti TaxID=2136147 RepID=UPI003DA71D8E
MLEQGIKNKESSLSGCSLYFLFFIMPVFAFANAGVVFSGGGGEVFGEVTVGVALGLLFGKFIGIFTGWALLITTCH